MTNTVLQPGQEKIAAAFSYLFFLIPLMMNVKTEFTMFHAKQSFALLCIAIIAVVVGFIIPPIAGLVQFVVFLVACWSAYQAYLGNRFVIPGIAEYTNNLITALNIAHLFKI